MTPRNRHAFFGGKIVPIEEAKVSIMTSALNYGTAIFEGIRGYWCAEEKRMLVFTLREHLERFKRNCKVLLLDLPYDTDVLHDAVIGLLQRERFEADIYVRPLAFKSSTEIGVRLHQLDCDCSIFALPFGRYIDKPGGITAMTSSWRRLQDNAIPARAKIAGSYANSALAKTEAVLNGFDEAILLTEDGHVSEGSAANLFIVRDGRLITPPVTESILEGIVRRVVLQLAGKMGILVQERPIDRSELYRADEIFLTGTAIELTAVLEVDHRGVGDGRLGPIFSRLSAAFADVVHGKDAEFRHLCTPVDYAVAN
jgi:branched-chain amino acid aminotransferase